MMRWVELAVASGSDPAAESAISHILVSNGCGGTFTGCYAEGHGTNDDCTLVKAYLPMDESLEEKLLRIRNEIRLLPDLGLEIPSTDIAVRPIDTEDWETAWKEYFKPIRIGRILVRPSWETCEEKPDDIVVELDPGMAFGTGNHATTRLCLQACLDYCRPGDNVLDMGTGSAILAIACAKLGAAKVTGIDVDNIALEAARENVELAGLSDQIDIYQGDSPDDYEGRAGLLVANIIAPVIVMMAKNLVDKTESDGTLIVSGIATERREEVIEALQKTGMRLVEEYTEEQWSAMVWQR